MMRAALIAALITALGLAVVAPAQAQEAVIAGPGSYLATFTTPVVTHVAGQPMTLVNADLQPHNVIATDAFRPSDSAPWCAGYQAGRCPLFWSSLIGLGETAPVEGLEGTAALRVYGFYCDYHPGMTGKLIAL